MMSVIQLFRNSTYFSIEHLFSVLEPYFDGNIKKVMLPCGGASPWALLRNMLYCAGIKGVVHITGDVHYAALTLRGSTTILTIHDVERLSRGRGLRNFLLKWLYFRLPMKKVRFVTCISQATKDELLKIFPDVDRGKIVVIPDPGDSSFIYSPRPFDETSPTILCFGRKLNKNLARIAQALQGIPCKLRIIGPPPPDALKKLRENGIQYSVGTDLTDEEIREEYRRCDLLCFPSLMEGFGLPILEAQSTGRPVITSDCSSMPEVAGKNGALLVNPLDETSIREGVLRICRDASLRGELIRAGRQNIQRFAPEKIAGEYMRLYRIVEDEQNAGRH